MRVLLVAYEFLPSASPQSLRWAYLVRELAARGHEVHVLTADTDQHAPGLPALPDGVRIHRTFAGIVRGTLALHQKYRRRHPRKAQPTTDEGAVSAGTPRMTVVRGRSWKLRLVECVQAMGAFVHFPDLRGEWRYWGRRALRRLVNEIDPDVVIASHEPATTLELALGLRHERPWIADLGDPVLAPYTPRRWQGRARRLERMVCSRAAAVIVTTEGTAALLRNRHGRTRDIHVLTQGFDTAPAEPQPADVFDAGRLELLYTGSLYTFRRIDALLAAVVSTPGVRLNIAGVHMPPHVVSCARAHPAQIRLLGFLPHLTARALQQQCDVLVNLANEDPVQVPGKFYEYLGAGRPILHLGDHADPVGLRMGELGRGWVCAQEAGAIAGLLERLVGAKAEQRLDDGLRLDASDIASHSWQQLGMQLDTIVREVGTRTTASTSAPARPA